MVRIYVVALPAQNVEMITITSNYIPSIHLLHQLPSITIS